jgi:hypothetical protein
MRKFVIIAALLSPSAYAELSIKTSTSVETYITDALKAEISRQCAKNLQNVTELRFNVDSERIGDQSQNDRRYTFTQQSSYYFMDSSEEADSSKNEYPIHQNDIVIKDEKLINAVIEVNPVSNSTVKSNPIVSIKVNCQ